MQVTVNVVKLVSIVTLQGFCYFRNFREKETILSVGGGRSEGSTSCSGSGPGIDNKTLNALAILIDVEMA